MFGIHWGDLLGFIVGVIIVRGVIVHIISRKIESWFLGLLKKPRNKAIWEHYQQDHSSTDVLVCEEGHCQLFIA